MQKFKLFNFFNIKENLYQLYAEFAHKPQNHNAPESYAYNHKYCALNRAEGVARAYFKRLAGH